MTSTLLLRFGFSDDGWFGVDFGYSTAANLARTNQYAGGDDVGVHLSLAIH